MEFLIIGIAVALNIIVIKMKFDRKRIEDGIFDSLLLATITVVFGGSFAGLVVGTIASFFISLYLLASPPKFFSGPNGFFKKFKERASRRHP
jgi:hypothetical protein